MSDPNLAQYNAEDAQGEVPPDADVRELVVKGLSSLFGDGDTATLTQLEDGGVEIDFGPAADPEAKAS